MRMPVLAVAAASLMLAAGAVRGLAEDAPQVKTRKLVVVLAKDRKLALDVTLRTVQTVQTGGAKVETDLDLAMTHAYQVESVDGKGVATIRTTLDRVHGTLSNPFIGRVEFDSDKKEEKSDDAAADGQIAAIRRQLTASAGLRDVVRLSPDGSFALVESTKPGSSSAPRLGGIPHLPAVAVGVGVGDTWTTRADTVIQEMRLVENVKHTIKQIGDDGVTIEHEGTLAPAADAPHVTVMSSKISGETRLSAKDGFVLSSSVVVEAETKTAAVTGRPAETMTTKQTIQQTVRERK